jgi:hypothetical protein
VWLQAAYAALSIKLRLIAAVWQPPATSELRSPHPHRNYPHPNNLRSRSQLTTHYSQLRRSRPVRAIRGKRKAEKLLAENRHSPQPLTFAPAFPTLGFPWRSNA